MREKGPAMRPSTSPTRTHNQLTAVVHRLRNPHPRPRVPLESDRRKRLERVCVGTPLIITSCRRGAILRGRVLRNTCGLNKIKLQWFARASHVLPPWSASVNEVAVRHAYRGQEYRGKAHTRSGARLVRNPYWTPLDRDVHHENKVLRNRCAERGRPSRASKHALHTHAQSVHGGCSSTAQSAPAATGLPRR